ncbi:UNVERIFIED_CONTAM: hypothetical protein Sradi_6214200 [Sesamum radiatum]|uniref:Reverse transcriptase/retrotransposon-derived protein RNase H-like domain-containing protein n=1 Tax=Sesamum radiatum TaxID=300843 RepID=A0AAW2KBJ0_SESRA
MNPLKCAFGVSSGKFLGFIVRHHGIEVDPAKVDAIQKMPPPRNLKELRSLQGNLAFHQKIHIQPRWKMPTLQPPHEERRPFQWDEGCQNAFESIKRHLLNPPVLGAPTPGKPLILPVLSGRLAKWSIVFNQYEIEYVPQKAIKGQALANFLADHPMPAEWEISDDFPDEDVFLLKSSQHGQCSLMEQRERWCGGRRRLRFTRKASANLLRIE